MQKQIKKNSAVSEPSLQLNTCCMHACMHACIKIKIKM